MKLQSDLKNKPDISEIAIAILNWLSEKPDMLSRFLALTGLDAGDLRSFSKSAGFNVSLLEFIMGHEPSLMDFCDNSGIAPEAVAAAWQKAAGPQYGSTGA